MRQLPRLVLVLALLGGAVIVLPLAGLGTRVAWTELPVLLGSDSAQAALGLSLRTCLVSTLISVALGFPAPWCSHGPGPGCAWLGCSRCCP